MPGKVHIFSVDPAHTTARYFERAVRADGHECIYWSESPALARLAPEDVLLFVDPAPDWPLGLETLGCRTVAYLIDVHLGLEHRLRWARFFDVVFVAQRQYVKRFLDNGCAVHWLPLACDPEIHGQPNGDRPFDVGFVGKLGRPGTWRHTILTQLLPRFTTNDYRRFHTPHEMGGVYGRSRIVLNASIGKELNMRFFEAMAAGAMLVTDRVPEALGDLFLEGVHYAGYDEASEAEAQIRHYLGHADQRLAIARAGQGAVLAGHTYLHRWRAMKTIIRQAAPSAPVRSYGRRRLVEAYAEVYADLRRPWRILQAMQRYGVTPRTLVMAARAAGRALNAYLPLTPNAIRQRLGRR